MVYQVPQKWTFACGECGCVFTINAKKQSNKCPVCHSKRYGTNKGIQLSDLNYYQGAKV